VEVDTWPLAPGGVEVCEATEDAWHLAWLFDQFYCANPARLHADCNHGVHPSSQFGLLCLRAALPMTALHEALVLLS